MKSFIALFLLSSSAFAYDLGGRWMNTKDGTVVNFIKVKDTYRQYSSASFTDQWGRLQYKIDQNVVIIASGTENLEGSVTFYDSRGCTFKDLPLVVEFQSGNTVSILMTVPRYKFQTITDRTYPRRPTVRHNCRVLEYVDVPVELIR